MVWHCFGVLRCMTKPKGRAPAHRRKLGLALRKRRNQCKLSQEKLAELAEVHRNYVGLVERGEQNITIDSLQKLAAAFRCRIADLLGAADI